MKLPSKVTSYKESVISKFPIVLESLLYSCLLYTSDAADEL